MRQGSVRVEADVEGVALVVIDGRIVEAGVTCGRADGDTDQPSGDVAALLGDLVGVGEMSLSESPRWGVRRVSSQARIRAPSMVTGK